MEHHLIPYRMAIIKNKTTTGDITSVGEDVKKRKPLFIVGGNRNWCSHYRKQ